MDSSNITAEIGLRHHPLKAAAGKDQHRVNSDNQGFHPVWVQMMQIYNVIEDNHRPRNSNRVRLVKGSSACSNDPQRRRGQ